MGKKMGRDEREREKKKEPHKYPSIYIKKNPDQVHTYARSMQKVIYVITQRRLMMIMTMIKPIQGGEGSFFFFSFLNFVFGKKKTRKKPLVNHPPPLPLPLPPP